jgi:hypothetical protein
MMPVAVLVIEVASVVCPEDPMLNVLGSEPPMLMVFEEEETSNDNPDTEFAVVDNVLATFSVLTETTVPADVAPEFVKRDAELDRFKAFVLTVLNEFDVCITDPVPELVPETVVITPVAVLVIEVDSVVCPEDPILKVLEGSEPPVLMVFDVVETSNDNPDTEFTVVDATFTVLTEVTVPVDIAPEFVTRDAALD